MKIKHKGFWFNYHTEVTPSDNQMFISLGGLVGCFAVAITAMLLCSVFAFAHPQAHGIIGIGGILMSDTLKQTRAAKAEEAQAKETEAQAIYDAAASANRKPTAEETTKFNSLIELKSALAKEIVVLTLRIDDQVIVEAALKDTPPANNPGAPRLDNDRTVVDYSRFRSGPLKHFKTDKDAYAAGMWLIASLWKLNDSYDPTPETLALIAKARKWCTENGMPSRFIQDSANEGTNSQGGYLVPATLETTIIDLRDAYGVVRRYAKVMPMSSNYQTQPKRTSGLTAYPVAEGVAITESSKGWGQVALTARKWGVLTRYSSEISEDAVIGIAQDLAQEIAYAFAIAEDNALFLGDGTSTYNGIVGLYRRFFDANVATFIGAPSAAATHNTYAEIDADDLDTLIATLPLYARRNARFYISKTGKSLVFDPLLRAAGGNTQADVSRGMPATYLGYPIEEVVAMDNVATYDFDEKPLMYFGDMAMAVEMGTRRGITLATSTDAYFTTDEIAIRGTERFDINVHSIGDSTNAGPLVALIGEAS